MKKYLLSIAYCLIISICCSLVVLQHSTYVKQRIVGNLITILEKEWQTKISVKKILLNFFTASIILENGDVKSIKHPNTYWGFKYAKISFGLWDALINKTISLYLTFYDMHGSTVSNKHGLELIDHVIDILTPREENIPIIIKKVFIKNATTKIAHNNCQFDALINGSFTFDRLVKNSNTFLQGCVLLENSTILLDNKVFAGNVSGSNIFYRDQGEKNWHITLHNTVKNLITSENKNYIFTGSYFQNDRSFMLQETNDQLNVKIAFNKNSIELEGASPLKTIALFYDSIIAPKSPAIAESVEGQCIVDLTLQAHPTEEWLCRGNISLEKPKFKNVLLDQVILKNVYLNQEIASTDVIATYNKNYLAQGNGLWNFIKHQGSISLANSNEIITTQRQDSPVYWSIPAQQATITLNIDKNLDTHGKYSASIHNSINADTHTIKGTITSHASSFCVAGNAQAYNYTINGSLAPTPHLTKIICTHEQECDPVINFNIEKNPHKTLVGHAQYGLVQNFLPLNTREVVLGKMNKIYCSIQQDKFFPIEGKIWTEGSRFFIPKIQNIIKNGSLKFSIDPIQRKIVIQNTKINFARGSISIPFASCEFAENSFDLQDLYMPLSTNNLLINPKKDFYSFIYGNLLLQKHIETPLSLSGSLVLRKTLIRGDVFNNTQQNNSNPLEELQEMHKKIDFSVRVINESPIIIKTPTIDALAHIDLQAIHKNQVAITQLPHVTGTINIDNGNLKFLENTLKIEYGKIQFLTRQIDDPVIDLIAKNRINKYVITLQVTGSLQKPTVVLESTPELSEEQILGLLFSGTENASLQADLPVMIMQNLNTILLGHRKPYDKTSMLIDTLSKPLKYVQITPDFTDQSGRSSVRAQVSVPFGKQFKAQFQKNLTFDEDLSVEIDYLLSDDINLKLVKDQRGELGSEVELRLKF